MLTGKQKTYKIFFTTAIFLVFFAVVFIFAYQAFAQVNYGVNYATNVGLSSSDIRVSIVRVIRAILGVLGILALLIVLYGGFVWMTAAGRPERVERAKKILLNGAIGLIIILMAFAIVQYIFTVLGGSIGGGTPGIVCAPGDIRGSCELCVATSNGLGRWEWQSGWPGCSGILPPTSLTLTDVQTSHAGPTDKDDVYWCSRVQNIFNHNINPATVNAASSQPALISDPLRIAADLPPWVVANGSWQTRGNVVTFIPENNEFINQDTNHRQHLPQSLEDTDGRFLSDCSLGAGCEGTPPPDFYWNFYVGSQGDVINPYIISTYPQSSDPVNPDINVSRDPIIEINFSEPIDATTVLDMNGVNPYPGHFYLEELDATGNPVNTIASSILIVQMKGDGRGFTVQLQPPNLLRPFNYYRVTVQDIEDLCGNIMNPNNYTWRFATNDQVPGINSYYPTGDNNCPDSRISFSFNTSMYYDWVRLSINRVNSTGGVIESWNYALDPSLSGLISTSNVNGEFRIVDAGLPFSTHYRVYEFIPASGLAENSFYEIYIETDKIINVDGDPLTHTWYFGVTDLDNCVCTPYISYLSRTQGPIGECITVNGSCFTGTAAQGATIDYINFDTTPATIGPGYTANWVTTVVPGGFSPGDRPQVTLAIDYASGNDVPPSNSREFLITSGLANGPCLWSVQPTVGPRGLTGLRLLGDRFGDYQEPNHQVIFTPNAVFNVTGANNWTNDEITNVVVPLTAQDGEVFVRNNIGDSNGIYFDVSYCGDNVIDSGEECDGSNLAGRDCTNFGWVGGSLTCDTTCHFDESQCSNAPNVLANGICQLLCNGGSNDGQVCYNNDDCPAGSCDVNLLPSPNPYRNASDVCLNAVISADFNTDIDSNSINSTNVFIQSCNDDNCLTLDPTHLPVSLTPAGARSFRLTPTTNLSPNTTYRVTLQGGSGGIASPSGIVMENDYIWHFKTKDETALCPIERVYVTPQDNSLGANQTDNTYNASAIAPYLSNNCTIINGENYDWQWTVDEPALGVTVTEDLVDDSNATVISGTEQGTVYVRATNLDENKYNRGRLNITFDTCAFNQSICPDPNQDGTDECPGSLCDLTVDRCTPVINSIDPTTGPTGRWVTLQGCHFKSGRGSGHVDFDTTPVSVYPCGETWTDSQIIVAVPSSLSSGNYNLHVTDRYGLLSNTSGFDVINQCLAGVPVPASGVPGICSLNPTTGMPNDSVSLSGENFGTTLDTVTFNGLSAPISSWGNRNIISQVPNGATDGNVVASVDSCPSNALYFDVESGNVGDPCDGNISTPSCDINHNLCWPGNYCEPNPPSPSPACSCQPIANANLIPASRFPAPGSTAECINIAILGTFDDLMNRVTLNSNNIELWQRVTTEPSRNGCIQDGTTDVWWCPISARVISYNVANGVDSCNNTEGCTVFSLSPRSPLPAPTGNLYEVHIRGGESGVKTVLGGQLNTTSPARTAIMAESYYWSFSVLDEICVIDHVDVDINFNSSSGIITRRDASYDYFTCAGRNNCSDDVNATSGGNQHEYIAQARDENNIAVAANYSWTEFDEKNLIQIGPPSDTQNVELTANPLNGQSIARVMAEDADLSDNFNYGSSTAAVNITNFMCQNPWPSLADFPYEDSAGNCNLSGSCYDMTFSTYYCRDYGHDHDYCLGGDDDGMDCDVADPNACPGGRCMDFTADDLPSLTYPGNIRGRTTGYCVGGSHNGQSCLVDSSCAPGGYCYNVWKEFMFYYGQSWCSESGILCIPNRDPSGCAASETCEPINDSIGIRIYNNSESLSPSAWYQKYANQPAGYTITKVDGYEAIASGRTHYISFAVDNNPLGASPIYTDMFLLSYTDNYQPVTLNIHDQLLANLKFNINGIDDARVCVPSGLYCTKDSECPSGETCDADKSKLARDVIRLGAVSEMVYHLELYRGNCSAHNNLACRTNTDCPDSGNAVDPEFCIIKNDSYPKLLAGTYLPGQSVSVWDSWNGTFASLLGTNLLIDPLNEVVNCGALYNEECWSQDLNNFQCNAGSHMYHYQTDPASGNNYSIYLNMEYANSGWMTATSLGSFSTSFSQPCSPGSYNLRFIRTSGMSGPAGH